LLKQEMQRILCRYI